MSRSLRRRLTLPVAGLLLLAGCSATVGGTAAKGTGSAAVGASSSSPAGSTSRADSSGGSAPLDGLIGSAGIGDPYYPNAGNGGYQVAGYRIDIHYDPPSNRLSGQADITGAVTADRPLARFNLDLQPTMTVKHVQVNGRPASFDHRQAELVITPATALPAGSALQVVVEYGGEPGAIAGGTANLGDGGWYRTKSGGAVAIGEPFSASAWYPVNEHPADTATFTITATVPAQWSVISNGLQVTDGLPTPPAGQRVFRWDQREPVASYLTTLYIDKFSMVTDKMADGRPIVSAFAPSPQADQDKKLAANTKRVIEVLGKHFGRYPFDAAGGIYTGEAVSFALETATRPVYANWVDLDTVVHELAHQWFGDDVTIKRWADICLNECFASYAPWLYHADVDGTDLDRMWVSQLARYADQPDFWSSPLVDMGAGNEFGAVYSRGPLAVHALRKEMGEKAFAAMLSGWVKDYGGKHASFDDWVAYVNKLAGKDLTPFINAWFRGTVVPPVQFRHPGGLGR